jgi:hypothetical protein
VPDQAGERTTSFSSYENSPALYAALSSPPSGPTPALAARNAGQLCIAELKIGEMLKATDRNKGRPGPGRGRKNRVPLGNRVLSPTLVPRRNRRRPAYAERIRSYQKGSDERAPVCGFGAVGSDVTEQKEVRNVAHDEIPHPPQPAKEQSAQPEQKKRDANSAAPLRSGRLLARGSNLAQRMANLNARKACLDQLIVRVEQIENRLPPSEIVPDFPSRLL